MRLVRHGVAPLAALALLAPRAAAVTIDWVTVGAPGNAPDPITTCPEPAPSYVSNDCGGVAYEYRIAKYEVTNAQYAEFLNAKAAADPHGLYEASMSFGGIARSGTAGSYSYAFVPGYEDRPVVYVAYLDALRFANWMHNGQGTGDTEDGAYTITLAGIAAYSIPRNPGATIFLPSQDEWFKAAYDDGAGNYFDYPTGSNAAPACSDPTAAPNSASCSRGALVDVGSYPGSPSPYGTFDQAGNASEWTEQVTTILDVFPSDTGWILRGGYYFAPGSYSHAQTWEAGTGGSLVSGFRLASLVPEPGTALLVMAGLVVLAGRTRTEDRAPR